MDPLTLRRWKQVEALLDRALEMEPGERERYLDQACADDAELRAEVEACLRADGKAGILDENVDGVARPVLEMMDGAGMPAAGPGQRFGPYRLVRELGVGGMGAVFLAERADGMFEQRVALKLVRNPYGGELLLRRFLEERRILAGLEHPHIARLLDGGVSEDGIPYFAMEYVEGEDLVRYCRRREFGVTERLRLFLDVCEAVAYAHRKLVVHRDIKPANILVTPEGEVKLLDFGIARLVEARNDAARTSTSLWLTPEYASPEQIRGEPISTASDIYSLGIVLYELLAGRRPYSTELAPHEMARAILEIDPVPPSAAGGSGWKRAGVARQRASDPADTSEGAPVANIAVPARLQRWWRGRSISGDLDAIVLQALRKGPDERYGGVELLAADIERYLGGLPVSARQGSVGYRARRFVARNRAPLAAVAILAVAGTTLGTAHTRALARERDVARAEAARAAQVSDFLVDLFAQSDPLGTGIGGRPVTDYLAIGADRLERELTDQPTLRAAMRRAVGKIYENLGSYDEANGHFEAVLSLREQGADIDLLAESLQDLGALRRRQGQHATADSLLSSALALRTHLGDPVKLSDVLEEVAELRRLEGDFAVVDSLGRAVLALRLEAFGRDHPSVAKALTLLGVVSRQLGDLSAAERHHREALTARIAHFGGEHVYVAESLRNLAVTLHVAGRLSEARALYEDALGMQTALLGETHPQLGSTRNSYGALLSSLGEHESALEQYRLVLDLRRSAYGGEHPSLATAITNFALAVREMGLLREAEELAREGLEMRVRLLAPDHPSVAHGNNVLGVILRDAGHWADAERHLLEAERIYVTRLGPEHSAVAVNRGGLAFVALERGDPAYAERLFESALGILRGAGLDRGMDAARLQHGLGRALADLGRSTAAAEALRTSLEIRRTELPADHPDIAAVESDLARLPDETPTTRAR